MNKNIFRTTGFSPELNAFELSMNRAVENAAPEAKTLFVGAIAEMTLRHA